MKVLLFGTFDGLHEGHKNFFQQALRFAQGKLSNPGEEVKIVVVVGRDSTVLKTKGRPPKYNEQNRLKAVQECDLVDEARLGNENVSPYIVIKEVNPDIICLGYDQTHFVDKLELALKEMDLSHIKIARLEAFEPEKYKSTLLNK